MRNLTRTEDAVTRFEAEAFAANFKDVLPFQHIPELILSVVKVALRTSLFVIQLFESKEGATGVLRQYLIGGVADTDGSRLAFAICPGGHANGLRPGGEARGR